MRAPSTGPVETLGQSRSRSAVYSGIRWETRNGQTVDGRRALTTAMAVAWSAGPAAAEWNFDLYSGAARATRRCAAWANPESNRCRRGAPG